MKNAIVIIVDRLGAGHLGPYGNTWIETAECNRLASQSMLAEYALTDSVDLTRVYRSYWQGIHAITAMHSGATLPEIIQPTAIQSALITDAEIVANTPGAHAFDERIVLAPLSVDSVADDVNYTEMARLFATAIDWLASGPPEPFLLWVHSQGLEGAWDAPLEYRNQFADEDDPEPPTIVTPPIQRLESDYDPDDLLGLQHAHAGQVALLDLCLGAFWETFGNLPIAKNTMLIFTSPRGYPLGEHGRVGAYDTSLYEESTHVPWIVRLPNEIGASVRIRDFIQPPDLFATVLDWLNLGQSSAGCWGRSLLPLATAEQDVLWDRACAQTGGFTAIRTPAWMQLCQRDRPEELFAKPDDRLEANEVSSLCPEVVGQLSVALADFLAAAEANRRCQLAALSPLLAEGLE